MRAIESSIQVGQQTLKVSRGYWSVNKAHHKLAYGLNTNLFCVGDANHVVEHVHHAGIMVWF